jgi:hypothetical protein
MSAVLKFDPSRKIVATSRRWWLDELRDEREEVREYARALTQRYERRVAEVAAHARRLGEIALELQEKEERRAQANTRIEPALETEFRRLADQWRTETAHLSVTFKRAMHPSYQRIIGMGKQAIPLILRELQERPSGNWFWALNAITGGDLARGETNINAAIRAWLQWGTEQGYV